MKRKRPTNRNDLDFMLETLENRQMLAGDVSAVVNGLGDLKLNGDKLDNDITISFNAAEVKISGNNGTTINGESSVSLFRDGLRDLDVNLRDGDDVLNFQGITPTLFRDADFQLGAGVDRVDLDNVNLSRNLKIGLGSGGGDAQQLKIGNGAVSGRLDVSAASNVELSVGDGTDLLTSQSASFSTGKGADLVDFKNFSTGDLSLKLGDGDRDGTGNVLEIVSSDFAGSRFAENLTILAGAQDDTVMLIGDDVGLFVFDNAEINLGNGSNELTFENLLAGGDLKVQGGAQDDTVMLLGDDVGLFVFNNAEINLGNGSNELTMENVQAGNDLIIKGGTKDDVLMLGGDDWGIARTLDIDTGGGVDEVAIEGITVGGNSSLLLGSGGKDGPQLATLSGIFSGSLIVDSGGHEDVVRLGYETTGSSDLLVGGETSVKLGGDRDILQISDEVTFGGPTTLNGETNEDNLDSGGFTALDTVTPINFENDTVSDDGSISGVVWNDVNEDGGRKDETFVEGRKVRLLTSAGVEVGSTTTNVDGEYIFDNLSRTQKYVVDFGNGDYTVKDAVNDTIDSDANASGLSDLIVLGATDVKNMDAGLISEPTTSLRVIGGRVWQDNDADGTRESLEPLLEGVTVNLWTANAGGFADTLVDSTETNIAGDYSFQVTDGERYVVQVEINERTHEFTTPDGQLEEFDSDITPSLGISKAVSVTEEAPIAIVDAGIVKLTDAEVNGVYWVDSNGDGVRQLPGGQEGEPVVTDTKVSLWSVDANGDVVEQLESVNTDENGFYRFDLFSSEDYVVSFVGDNFTVRDAGDNEKDDSDVDENGVSEVLDADPGDVFHIGAGQVAAGASISGQVWDDFNQSGLLDGDEFPGYEGFVAVNLWTVDGTAPALVATTQTDFSTGGYAFTGLDVTQTYVVQFQTEFGFGFTEFTGDSGGLVDSDVNMMGVSDPVILVADGTTTVDAGLYFSF